MKKDIFYIRKYHYIKSEAELDLSSIAPLQRRRLSLADKIAFTVMDKVFDENIEADIQAISEDEELDEAGVRELRNWFASWYKGEGVYYNDSRDVMMLKGDECYSFDTMSYSIKSF